MKDLKLFLTIPALVTTIFLFLFYISESSRLEHQECIEALKKGYNYGEGKIVDFHSYKGQTMRIEYKIDGVDYWATEGWDNNWKGLGVGDSIKFKYALSQPKFILTELDDEYDTL